MDRDPKEHDVEVIALNGGSISLKGGSPGNQPEFVGLEWSGGYARADGLTSVDGNTATRGFDLVAGELSVGDRVRYDKHAWCCDPGAMGFEFSNVRIDTELGEVDAWSVDAGSESWVVFIHGKDSDRTQGLRLLPILVDAGWNVLLTTYRNHESSPADPSNRHNYGATEWRDIESAVRYVQDVGAQRIVLAGWSMGGATSLAFMRESGASGDIDGLILGSPVISLERAVDFGAEQLSLPGFLTESAKWLADVRFGIDWDAMNYMDIAAGIEVPVLLLRGDADETVSTNDSDLFAEGLDVPNTLITFGGGRHTALWNSNPELFDKSVSEYLSLLP
ncbi:MAG: alpha/beta fold hydrolase [Chloroflexi bacterium]|nr:alpha/beta fold hydrolase [Chloroflexota bacterium]